jgi:hypothetical protein
VSEDDRGNSQKRPRSTATDAFLQNISQGFPLNVVIKLITHLRLRQLDARPVATKTQHSFR